MDSIFGSLPQLAGLIEKGGVIGLLLIVCGVLVYEIKRGRRIAHEKQNELAKVYGQRDKALMALIKVKTVCESHNIKVDLSDVDALMQSVAPPLLSSGMSSG